MPNNLTFVLAKCLKQYGTGMIGLFTPPDEAGLIAILVIVHRRACKAKRGIVIVTSITGARKAYSVHVLVLYTL